jgi:DNA polymerase III delta subunit
LSDVFVQRSDTAIEKNIFYGTEEAGDLFAQSLVNLGMFTNRQIILYKEINRLPAEYHQSLLNYLENTDSNILLILTAGSGPKSSFFNKLRKHTKITNLSTWTPDSHYFPALIQHKLQKGGFEISPDALTCLTEATDDSLSHAFAEVEKILVYMDNRSEVTVADVRAIVGGEKDYQMSDFNQAVANRDLYQAIHICLALIETNNDTPYFITALYRLFVNGWAYRQIHANSKPSYFPAKKKRELYKNVHSHYSDRDYSKIFAKLLAVDLQAKSTGIDAKDLLIPLIFELVK